jgi:membrane dipeptidase
VAYFTTPEHWAWYERGEAHWAELKGRHGNDRAAARKDMAQWETQNPAPPVTLANVANHLDHVRKVAGIDHVGLGADFDGMESYRISGLEDSSTFPALFEELVRRGWSDAELRKLAGENFLRVLAAVEQRARRSLVPRSAAPRGRPCAGSR